MTPPSSRLVRERVSPTHGAVLRTALQRKHANYPELADGGAQAIALRARLRGGWAVEHRCGDAGQAPRRPPRAHGAARPCKSRVGAPLVERALRRGPTGRWSHCARARPGHPASGALPGPAHTDAPDLSEVLDLAEKEGGAACGCAAEPALARAGKKGNRVASDPQKTSDPSQPGQPGQQPGRPGQTNRTARTTPQTARTTAHTNKQDSPDNSTDNPNNSPDSPDKQTGQPGQPHRKPGHSRRSPHRPAGQDHKNPGQPGRSARTIETNLEA